MTDENNKAADIAVMNYKIESLERSEYSTRLDISEIQKAISALTTTTEKIAVTLERIQRLESENKDTLALVNKLSDKIDELQRKMYQVIGGLATVVFFIEIASRFIQF